MKDSNTLKKFYDDALHPDLKKLETSRKTLAIKIILVSLAIAATSIFLTLFIISYSTTRSEIDFAPLLLGLFVIIVAKKMMSKDFTSEFKNNIIEPLIKHIDENLSYSKDRYVAKCHFKDSYIYKTSIDSYHGNDLIEGTINGVKLQFSDVHAEHETKTEDEDGHDDSSLETIFQGLFLRAEFNKNFKGRTVILPDKAEKRFGKLLGSWLQSKNMNRSDLVKMDNNEFEKHFVVYGTDQVEARYILTHSMMDRLLEYTKRVSVPLNISFNKNHIYLALEYNKDLFEPTVFSSLLKYELIKEYASTLELAVSIVEELKLNEKLWSKQ